jgi:CheY-like chemotaxis protein
MSVAVLLMMGDSVVAERLTTRLVEARCDVETATDLDRARRLMRILAFEVVVIDMTAPVFDVAVMAEHLRELAAPRRLHVVALFGASVRAHDGPPRGFDACVSRSQTDPDIVAALGSPGGPRRCLCPKRAFTVLRGATL